MTECTVVSDANGFSAPCELVQFAEANNLILFEDLTLAHIEPSKVGSLVDVMVYLINSLPDLLRFSMFS